MLLRQLEPPPGYVAFVELHLEPLRRAAARVVGDERDADHLYPDVLTDVATRWSWLELLRNRFGRSDAAERYLGRAFERRSQRWRSEADEVWAADGVLADVRVLPAASFRAPRPAWSSVAVRLAPHTGQPRRLTPGPVAEAAVAWWHAYEAKRRYLYVAALVAVFAFFAMVIRYDAAAALVAAAVPTVRRGF